MPEPARTSKSLKQLCTEAWALSGYLRNNPTDDKALRLLESTVREARQLQTAIKHLKPLTT